jgi:hypothetical protein
MQILHNAIGPEPSGKDVTRQTANFHFTESVDSVSQVPIIGFSAELLEQAEIAAKRGGDKLWHAYFAHNLENFRRNDGKLSPLTITFTQDLRNIRPMTPIENFMSLTRNGTYRGMYGGVVTTITNADGSGFTTSVYSGELWHPDALFPFLYQISECRFKW